VVGLLVEEVVVLITLDPEVSAALVVEVPACFLRQGEQEHQIQAVAAVAAAWVSAVQVVPVSSSSHTLHKNINTSKTIRKCQRYKLIILLIRMIMEPQVFLLV
jgi:hypothetical protein